MAIGIVIGIFIGAFLGVGVYALCIVGGYGKGGKNGS